MNNFKFKIINIHPSILPAFKGKDSIKEALLNGNFIAGCSVHFVETEVDSGKLLIQGAVQINKDDDLESLEKRIHFLEHKILPFGVSEAGKVIRNKFMDKN